MNAVNEAAPSVCAQLMSCGTFRKRNHFVYPTRPERSSVQSSGMSAASAREGLREVFVAISGSPRRSRSRNGIEPPLDAVDVDARVRLVVLHDLRARTHALNGSDAEQAAEHEVPVLDRELVPVERADGWAGGAVALGVVEAAVARAAEARSEDRPELDAVDLLLRLLVDRAVGLHGAPEMCAAAEDRGEARHAVVGAAVVADERGAARNLSLLGALEIRRDHVRALGEV